MSVLGTARSLEHDYLHVLYELAGRRQRAPFLYNEVRMELGRSDKEVEQASDFWADRGVVEWTGIGMLLSPV